MAQCARLMAFENLSLQVFTPSAPYGGQEVREVVLTLPLKCAHQLPFQVKQRATGNNSLSPFENGAPLVTEGLRLQAARLRNDRFIAKIEHTNLRVWRLAGVGVAKPAAIADDRTAEP